MSARPITGLPGISLCQGGVHHPKAPLPFSSYRAACGEILEGSVTLQLPDKLSPTASAFFGILVCS